MSTTMKTTLATIDDRRPVPEGEFPAAVRLIAFLGSGTHFAGPDPRSAWQWAIRIDDGPLVTMTFLVNHNRQPIRMFSAALTGDASLLEKSGHCDARQVIGRSAMVRVRHKPLADGPGNPEISGARPLPVGVEPIILSDACVWTPRGRCDLPRWVPQWVCSYANTAVRQDWETRQSREASREP
jgi:hypothetical protein